MMVSERQESQRLPGGQPAPAPMLRPLGGLGGWVWYLAANTGTLTAQDLPKDGLLSSFTRLTPSCSLPIQLVQGLLSV